MQTRQARWGYVTIWMGWTPQRWSYVAAQKLSLNSMKKSRITHAPKIRQRTYKLCYHRGVATAAVLSAVHESAGMFPTTEHLKLHSYFAISNHKLGAIAVTYPFFSFAPSALLGLQKAPQQRPTITTKHSRPYRMRLRCACEGTGRSRWQDAGAIVVAKFLPVSRSSLDHRTALYGSFGRPRQVEAGYGTTDFEYIRYTPHM